MVVALLFTNFKKGHSNKSLEGVGDYKETLLWLVLTPIEPLSLPPMLWKICLSLVLRLTAVVTSTCFNNIPRSQASLNIYIYL